MTSKPARVAALATLTPLLLVLLCACAPTVALAPAADAANPGCANAIVRLPGSVDGLEIRQTDAQATGAWGSPAAIILRCGITPPGPSTDRCYTVGGIDWLRDTSKAPTFIYTTFGRTPAIQVTVDGTKTTADGATALSDLANAVGFVKQTRRCLVPVDSAPVDSPPVTPAP